MHHKVAERIAGFLFTVVVPGLVWAMNPHISPNVGWPLIFASVLVGLAAFFHGGRRFSMGPIIVMGVGGVVFVAGAIWNYRADHGAAPQKALIPVSLAKADSDADVQHYAAQHDSSKVVEQHPPSQGPKPDGGATPRDVSLEAKNTVTNFDHMIDIRCEHPSPVDALPGRTFRVVNPFEGDESGIGPGKISSPANWATPTGNEAATGLLCTVTNYSTEPVQDVTLSMSAATTARDKDERVNKRVHLEKIDPGINNAFAFYIQNSGPNSLKLKFLT